MTTGQGEFGRALLDPGRAAPAGLTDPAGRPAGRRFDVYRNNVTVGLTEALRQPFPTVRKLVGEEFFTAMAQAHLRAHPPRTPVMMFYGADMPEFLERFAPVADLPYLPDVARLELGLRGAYHAADADPVPAGDLQALAPEAFMTARLRFAPAVRLVASRWPVVAIWRANMQGAPPPDLGRGEDALILRPGFDPEPHALPPGAAPFAAALIGGASVAEALDRATEAFDLTATLSLFLAGGAITGLLTEG